ncbi:MAG TPA: META domain-containing protein [Dongiaceae bacterium]|jgi:heat shock protein HslJ
MRRIIGTRRLRAAWILGGAVAAALSAAGCASKAPGPSIVGLWAVQEVTGRPVPKDARVTLSLYGDGRAVGRAGCNNYTGNYTRDGASGISFGPIASTKMACAPEVMAFEGSYLAALGAVTRVDRQPDNALVLSTGHGAEILLQREESASLQDARARGIDFRAVGQEPAWVVEMKLGDHITAVLDYGATPLLLPTPKGETSPDGAQVYDTSTDTDHLVLTIRSRPCIDAKSGESHSSTVGLMVNEKTLQGCGDWLD